MRRILHYLIALLVLSPVCGLFAAFYWGSQGLWQDIARGIVLAAGCLLVDSAFVSAARGWSTSLWVSAGLLLLLVLFLPASTILWIFPPSGSEPLGGFEGLALFSIATLALILAAALFYTGQRLLKDARSVGAARGEQPDAPRQGAGQAAAVLALGALLLAKSIHSVYWLMVWDRTTDPLGAFWLVLPIFAVLFTGVLLSILLARRTRWLGAGYTLLVPALLVAAASLAGQVDLHDLTEARAERASQAIERYYQRNGHYPPDLRQLPPWEALALPRPVIIFGQEWCYDGGEDYYRLGYVDREHWSDPRLVGRVHKTAGVLPELHPICQAEVATLQARDPSYPYVYWKEE